MPEENLIGETVEVAKLESISSSDVSRFIARGASSELEEMEEEEMESQEFEGEGEEVREEGEGEAEEEEEEETEAEREMREEDEKITKLLREEMKALRTLGQFDDGASISMGLDESVNSEDERFCVFSSTRSIDFVRAHEGVYGRRSTDYLECVYSDGEEEEEEEDNDDESVYTYADVMADDAMASDYVFTVYSDAENCVMTVRERGQCSAGEHRNVDDGDEMETVVSTSGLTALSGTSTLPREVSYTDKALRRASAARAIAQPQWMRNNIASQKRAREESLRGQLKMAFKQKREMPQWMKDKVESIRRSGRAVERAVSLAEPHKGTVVTVPGVVTPNVRREESVRGENGERMPFTLIPTGLQRSAKL